MLGLALLTLLGAADLTEPSEPAPSDDEGLHRGVGWYSPDARIPEPPLALALVIVAAAGMRARERRRRARAR